MCDHHASQPVTVLTINCGRGLVHQLGPLNKKCICPLEGYVSGGIAAVAVYRNFSPKQFLHDHRAGNGAVTDLWTLRGRAASMQAPPSEPLSFGTTEDGPFVQHSGLMVGSYINAEVGPVGRTIF